MTDSLKAFLNSVAYHADDVPMIGGEEAESIIDSWKDEGVEVPEDLTPIVLCDYHNAVIEERHPFSDERLNPVLEDRVFKYLSGIGYDFHDGLAEPITFVEAYVAVEDFRKFVEEGCPDFLTADVFMRWINSHYADRKRDTLWITFNDGGHEAWRGPYRTLHPVAISYSGKVTFEAEDCFGAFTIHVPALHEIMTRDDL